MSGGKIAKDNSPEVLIIGGGVAGLAAAVELISKGFSVLLIEQKHRLGGRTYSFIHPETGEEVDNGQHLMMGCYHFTLKYLKTINAFDTIQIQKNLSIIFRREKFPVIKLQAFSLPAPFNILFGLFQLHSISLINRLKMIRVGIDVLLKNPDRNKHLRKLSVDQWFNELGQSKESRKYLWDILAIGALNDSTEKISAALFAKVLKAAFFGSKNNASMIIPKRGLSEVLVTKAAKYIESQGSRIRLNTTVSNFEIKNSSIVAVTLDNGFMLRPSVVVSAVPYFDIPKLFLKEHLQFIPELKMIDQFVSSPIVTIHLWYDAHFMKEEFVALLDSPLHWVFNKSLMYGKGEERLMYLAVVISDADKFLDQTKEDIVELAKNEIRRFYPMATSTKIIHSIVIKEKRATFSPRIGIHDLRPKQKTSFTNFFLAGDWTDTKLPATIEGAIQSGFECAKLAERFLRPNS